MDSMSIDYIKQRKLCPFMSDSSNKVYCTPECALVETHSDAESHVILGTTCSLGNYQEIIAALQKD